MVAIEYTPISLLFIVSTVVQSILLAYILTSPQKTVSDHTTRTLAYLLVGGIIWTGAYGVHLILVEPSAKLLWVNLSQLGPSIVAPALLLHISTYASRYSLFTRPRRALLLIEPIISTGLILTDPFHDLFRTDTELLTLGATSVIHRSAGPWWYLRTGYLYVLIIVAFVWLLVAFRNAEGPIRRQLGAGLIAVSVPIVANGLFDLQYLFEIVAIQPAATVEFTGVAFGISATILTYSVYRYQYLDLVPVGRHLTIDRLPDPYIITDQRFQIVDYNEAVTQIVEGRQDLTNRPLFEILPELESVLTDEDFDGQDPVLEQLGDLWFEILVIPLQNAAFARSTLQGVPTSDEAIPETFRGDEDRVRGYSIFLRDVTDRVTRERVLETWNEQLELLNQIVRHDIRNDANFIVSVVQRLQRMSANADRENPDGSTESPYLGQIAERGNQIVALTKRLRDLTETVSELGEERKPIALDEVLEREVVNASTAFENAHIRYTEEIPSVKVNANEMLSSVFHNLFTNAIKHNDKPKPRVTVSTSVEDETVTIRIVDNGPGLSAERMESINRGGKPEVPGGETEFGLYIVETLVYEYGGELTVRDNEPEGTVFHVTLERVEN